MAGRGYFIAETFRALVVSVPLTKLILRLVLGSHATVPAMQQ